MLTPTLVASHTDFPFVLSLSKDAFFVMDSLEQEPL